MSGHELLRLEGLTKSFGETQVLKGISLTVYPGEFVTLLGPSGCGKTTTLRIIAGLEQPDAGSVQLEGVDITALEPEKRNVNTVFQSYALFPHMNVEKNISYGLRVRGVKRDEWSARVREMLSLVRLEGFEKRMPSQLSGGQRQRVAIARAVVLGPKLLLLDEPLGALDLKLRQQMQMELKDIQKRLGIAFVYITHDQEEALNMSDRIAIMRDGQFEQVGAPEDIYERPQTRFAAEFIGQTNMLECRVAARAADGALVLEYAGEKFPARAADFEAEVGSAVALCLRTERLHYGVNAPEGAYLDGVLKARHYAGGSMRSTIGLADGREIVAIGNSGHADGCAVGGAVKLYWNADEAAVVRC